MYIESLSQAFPAVPSLPGLGRLIETSLPPPSRQQIHYVNGAAFDSSACTFYAFWQRNIIDSYHKSNISPREAPASL